MKLLEQLCNIHAPSGNEKMLTDFLLNYIETHKVQWKVQPVIVNKEDFQDCILLIFGRPRAVVFAHLDSIGFTVRYGRQLVPIGGPVTKTGYKLTGSDSQGEIKCTLKYDEEEGDLTYDYDREIERGTELVFESDFRETEDTVQSCYMDNRLGVWA